MLNTSNLIVTTFLVVGATLLVASAARLRRRRLLAATRAAAGGCLCLLLATLAFAIALNLYTYQRLTREQPVARLHFERLEAQRFRVQLATADGPTRNYLLAGNQWQLEARVLKWQSWATLLGFDARYRLDRLSGRYQSIEAQRNASRTIYSLSESRGLDVWQAARHLPRWLDPIDARFGSATYLPMADDARYAVELTQSGGLVARPTNAAAKAAVKRW